MHYYKAIVAEDERIWDTQMLEKLIEINRKQEN